MYRYARLRGSPSGSSAQQSLDPGGNGGVQEAEDGGSENGHSPYGLLSDWEAKSCPGPFLGGLPVHPSSWEFLEPMLRGWGVGCLWRNGNQRKGQSTEPVQRGSGRRGGVNELVSSPNDHLR